MLRSALAVSAALHGLLGMWVEVRGSARAPIEQPSVDAWAGRGIEVDTVPLATETAPASADTPSGNTQQATRAVAEGPASTHASAPEPAVAPVEHMQPVRPHRTAPSTDAAIRPRAVSATARSAAPAVAHTEPATVNTSRASASNDAASSVNATSSANAPSTANAPSGASGQTFGAAGLPPGVRHLPKAFTRALSVADRGDPRWLALPAGPAGEVRIELPVDEDGKLGDLTYPDETERDKLAPVVRHLLENTRLLLENGHFSLDPSMLRAGVERLRVRVEVVEPPTTSVTDGDPNELKELEYEAPAHGKPGRGSFALNSGRRVIGWVYLE